jgi:hypothetical protein
LFQSISGRAYHFSGQVLDQITAHDDPYRFGDDEQEPSHRFLAFRFFGLAIKTTMWGRPS